MGDRQLTKSINQNSSILPWEIPWTEEPYGLQSLGCQRTGHHLVTERTRARTHIHTHKDKCY